MGFLITWTAFASVSVTAALGIAISLLERQRVVPTAMVGGYYLCAVLSLPLLVAAVIFLHPWTADGAQSAVAAVTGHTPPPLPETAILWRGN